jgi:transcriptional regulator with XRE-family HTH domain
MDDLLKHRPTWNSLTGHIAVKGSTADRDLRRKCSRTDTVLIKIAAKLHDALHHHNGAGPSTANHHPGHGINHRFGKFSGVPNRIREIRERLGLTQEQLAERVGTTSQQISRLEKGQRGLDVPWMLKISAALGERPAALIDEIADSTSGLPSERKLAQNEEELWLLEAWRALNKSEQRLLRRALHGLAASLPDE